MLYLIHFVNSFCMSSAQRLQLFHGFVSYILQYGYSWINYMANVRNVAAPCAWSADFYDLSRNAYRNNDLPVKMLHPTTAYYAMF